MQTSKWSVFNRIFRSPLYASIFGTLVSLGLAALINFLFLSPESLGMTLLITLIIAAPMSYITINRVLSMRTTIEQQRIRLAVEHERASILSRFMRDAAHEFKTPLTLMSTNLYLAEKSTNPEKREGYVNNLYTQITTLNTLVETILILTRLDSTNPSTYVYEQVHPAKFLSDLRAFNADGRINILMPDITKFPVLQLNISDFHLAFKQILGNALRYSPSDSPVTVQMAVSDQSLVLEVIDRGSGMPPETVNKVFNRFYRADESHTTRGLGLGLAIAQRVVQLHNGDIQIQSEVNKGTTVTVSLPVQFSPGLIR